MLGLLVAQTPSQSRAQPLVHTGMEKIFVSQEASAAPPPWQTSSFVFSQLLPQPRQGQGLWSDQLQRFWSRRFWLLALRDELP